MDTCFAEFEDGQWYDPWPDPPAPSPEAHTLDPWRGRFTDVLLIPRHIVESVVQPDWMRNIEVNEMGKVFALQASIAEVGLQEPLIVAYDDAGKIALRHGHHRTMATRGWSHFDWLPVRLQKSERITVHRAARIGYVLFDMLFHSVPELGVDGSVDGVVPSPT